MLKQYIVVKLWWVNEEKKKLCELHVEQTHGGVGGGYVFRERGTQNSKILQKPNITGLTFVIFSWTWLIISLQQTKIFFFSASFFSTIVYTYPIFLLKLLSTFYVYPYSFLSDCCKCLRLRHSYAIKILQNMFFNFNSFLSLHTCVFNIFYVFFPKHFQEPCCGYRMPHA